MVDVVLVGCGCPKRGMGWYHLTQLLEMPNARMKAVVEPWYLGAGGSAPGAAEFMAMKTELEAKGVAFYASLADMPAATGPTCALIAGRTADNPKFFAQCVEKGVQNIYLEKPGAPSVGAHLRSLTPLAFIGPLRWPPEMAFMSARVSSRVCPLPPLTVL